MITIDWGSADKTVLLYTFEERWTIQDLIEALDAGVQVAEKYQHDMDVLVDLTRSGYPDLMGSNVFSAFGKAVERSEAHMDKSTQELGLVVVVSQDLIVRSTLSTLLGMYRKIGEKLALANSLEEARRIIAQRRQSVQMTPRSV